MSISSQQRTWILVGVLVIIGGGALVYFDPLDLNLLGEKPSPAVAKPAPPHVPVPVAKPAVTKPPEPKPPGTKLIGAVAAQLAVPAMASAPAATPAVDAPSKASFPAAAMSAAESETATPSDTATPGETSAQKMHPPMKSAAMIETDRKPATAKPIRPKNLDLRYCLELDSDAAIAKCAGE